MKRLTGLILAALLAEAVAAGTIATSFEFRGEASGFTLGESPELISFSGGEAQSIGVLSLYHSGSNAWMINSGEAGTISFETPAAELHFFIRNQEAGTGGLVRILDEAGNTLLEQAATDAEWTEVNFSAGNGDPAAASVEYLNQGSSGFAVLDDFEYSALTLTGPGDEPVPLDDPIALPISPGMATIRIEPLSGGLVAPNYGTFAPGHDDYLVVTDQSGLAWTINLETGERSEFLDLRSRLVEIDNGGAGSFDERGLIGIAFHPDYAQNGKVHTSTSEPGNGIADFPNAEGFVNHQAVIAEWQVLDRGSPTTMVDLGTRRELLRVDQPQSNHNGGAISFGPDGMLYIALGDGGNSDDQGDGHGNGNGQNAANVLGALLRIDVDGNNSGNGQYGIPA